jgi:hypothetical protein
MQISWPLVVGAVGVVAVVALVVFLIMQSGGSSTNFDEADIAAEADSSTDLPGEYVDLPAIYGGAYPETAGHVREDVDYAAVGNSNPPAGGPHWSGTCGEDPTAAPPFCGPAPWGIYRDPWDPETLVHNMEHGGVVVWYNSDDPAVRDQLEAVVKERLDDGKFIVLAPYPDMEDDTIAITSWSRLDKFPASELTDERVNTFIDANERRFNPEHIA